MVFMRLMFVLGLVLIGLGGIPWMLSNRSPIHEVHNLFPMLAGWALVVMGWQGVGRCRSHRLAVTMVWGGILLGVCGWFLWERSHQSPENKLALLAFPTIPGCFLAVMGWSMSGSKT